MYIYNSHVTIYIHWHVFACPNTNTHTHTHALIKLTANNYFCHAMASKSLPIAKPILHNYLESRHGHLVTEYG